MRELTIRGSIDDGARLGELLVRRAHSVRKLVHLLLRWSGLLLVLLGRRRSVVLLRRTTVLRVAAVLAKGRHGPRGRRRRSASRAPSVHATEGRRASRATGAVLSRDLELLLPLLGGVVLLGGELLLMLRARPGQLLLAHPGHLLLAHRRGGLLLTLAEVGLMLRRELRELVRRALVCLKMRWDGRLRERAWVARVWCGRWKRDRRGGREGLLLLLNHLVGRVSSWALR